MSQSYRPISHEEREQAMKAVEALVATNETAATIHEALTESSFARYRQIRANVQEAEAASIASTQVLDEADIAFDKALRAFFFTVRDAYGRPDTYTLKHALGGNLPTKLVYLKPKEELNRVKSLLKRANGLGNDELRAAVGVAVEALETAMKDNEKVRARQKASAMATAENLPVFDDIYARLVRALRSALGDEAVAAALPAFNR